MLLPGTFFCPDCGRRAPEAGARDAAPDASIAAPPDDGLGETVSFHFTAPPARGFALIATTGQRFEVRGRALLGRNPTLEPDEHYDAVLVLTDDGKTISKRHLELVVIADQLLVTDLGSGNGTIVEVYGQPPVRLTTGMPQPVPRGAVLRLGKHHITVE